MKVGMYTRTAAGGGDAIGRQGQTVRSAAEAHGDEVAAEFVDDGYSGAEALPSRPPRRHSQRLASQGDDDGR